MAAKQKQAPSNAEVKTRRRSPSPTRSAPKSKRIKGDEGTSLAPIETARLSAEHPEWPARPIDLARASQFIRRAARAASGDKRCNETILLVPDKDADGLSAGTIVKRTLLHLGAKQENIKIHHIRGGQAPTAREDLESYGASWIIVLDQGSGTAPPLVKGAEMGWQEDNDPNVKSEDGQERYKVQTMVLDHHHVNDLDNDCPQGALLVNACKHLPVSTSALLAWCICRPMWPQEQGASDSIDYLALIGTCGDLSVNVSWDAPWPDFAPELKHWGRSKIGQIVALVNAPRRTPQHDAKAAWDALDASQSPFDVLSPESNPSYKRLQEARSLVAAETEKCTHTPPKFAKDGRAALLTIHTAYQVHPSIATRWSGTLKGAKKLQIVMCANTGFGAEVEDQSDSKDAQNGKEADADSIQRQEPERYVHFSCRIANAAKSRGEEPNIIALLHDYAARDPEFLKDVYASGQGHFARGHKEASGGILPPHLWNRFVALMEIGVKPSPPPNGTGSTSSSPKKPVQSNKLTNYFAKPAAASE